MGLGWGGIEIISEGYIFDTKLVQIHLYSHCLDSWALKDRAEKCNYRTDEKCACWSSTTDDGNMPDLITLAMFRSWDAGTQTPVIIWFRRVDMWDSVVLQNMWPIKHPLCCCNTVTNVLECLSVPPDGFCNDLSQSIVWWHDCSNGILRYTVLMLGNIARMRWTRWPSDMNIIYNRV